MELCKLDVYVFATLETLSIEIFHSGFQNYGNRMYELKEYVQGKDMIMT